MKRALGFLTIFGGASNPDPRTILWFGPVGALIGAALGGIWWAAESRSTALLAGALVVVADLVITGLLHIDGLGDTGDGLVAPIGDRTRRLEAMSDPAIGAFGAVTIVAVLLLRVAALASTAPDVWLLIAIWVASRSLAAVALVVMPYAKAAGLPSDFRVAGDVSLTRFAPGIIGALLAGAAAAGSGLVAFMAIAVGVISGLAVLALAARRLGGFTGDVLGAAIVITETVALTAAALL